MWLRGWKNEYCSGETPGEILAPFARVGLVQGYKSCEDEANRVIANQPIASSAAFFYVPFF